MQARQLHITNGDATADIIKASKIAGDVLSWRDPMHHGPFPGNHDLDSVSNIRAKYLAGYGLDEKKVKLAFHTRNELLRAFTRYDEVVLWFEHDLLDQLQVLQLLHWFGGANKTSTELTMICINKHSELSEFRGLGQLSCEQFDRLLPTRVPISNAQLQLAKSVWDTFVSDNPTSLEKQIQKDTAALPFLKAALHRHLQEFPWTEDGLSRTERQILTLVASGAVYPQNVFTGNMQYEDALFIGDWHTYKIISDLCTASTPLLICRPDAVFRYPPDENLSAEVFQRQVLSVSEAGRSVLELTQSARSLIHRDDWLGGVHLQSDKAIWMWNNSSTQLVLN